jgi:hypothetical protein
MLAVNFCLVESILPIKIVSLALLAEVCPSPLMSDRELQPSTSYSGNISISQGAVQMKMMDFLLTGIDSSPDENELIEELNKLKDEVNKNNYSAFQRLQLEIAQQIQETIDGISSFDSQEVFPLSLVHESLKQSKCLKNVRLAAEALFDWLDTRSDAAISSIICPSVHTDYSFADKFKQSIRDCSNIINDLRKLLSDDNLALSN